jgi:HEPN domain-containing protein
MPGVKDWIAKASSNLKAARKLVKDDDDTLDLAAYSTQQSAEKSLKAYLIFKQQAPPRTHDLEKLLAECMKYDETFDVLKNAAEALSPYATYTRYPDDRFNIDREEAMLAIKHAEKILKFVQFKLNPSQKTPQLNIFES